jgi:hypothetical protein
MDSVDRLASTYDAASIAVDTFARSVFSYDPMAPRPTVRARLRAAARHWVARRGGIRSAWFATIAVLVTAFMAWVSLRIFQHLRSGPPPMVIEAVPGVLLALALVSAATRAASGAGRPWSRSQSPGPVWPGMLFTSCLAGNAAWVTAWLTISVGVRPWAAVLIAVVALVLVGVMLVAAGRASAPARAAGLPAVRCSPSPPRRLLDQQRSAQELVRGHARKWSSAAQQCGAAIDGSANAEALLLRLLIDDAADLPLNGVAAFHAQLLAGLSRYRPDLLGIRLREASQKLLPREARP